MKKLILSLIFALTLSLLGAGQAQALYGLEKYWAAVYDENGNVRTDVSTVTVYTAGTTTAATVYADDQGTALTNPITTGLSDGVFEFYSASTSVDILIQAGSRGIKLTSWTTSSKHQIVIDSQVGVAKSIQFFPDAFIGLNSGESSVVPITTTTTGPRLSLDNGLVALEWDDNDGSYAQVTFKVPADYLEGGGFKIFTDYDSGSDAPPIHYRVFVNRDGTAWDASATAQTAVDPGGTAGTPELSTLSISTDFSSLAANDVVTLQIRRADTDSSTADLEVYYVEFYYNAKN